MRSEGLNQLVRMAAKLSATARKLPQGKDRQNAFREISKFRNRIATLIIAEQSAQRTSPAYGAKAKL